MLLNIRYHVDMKHYQNKLYWLKYKTKILKAISFVYQFETFPIQRMVASVRTSTFNLEVRNNWNSLVQLKILALNSNWFNKLPIVLTEISYTFNMVMKKRWTILFFASLLAKTTVINFKRSKVLVTPYPCLLNYSLQYSTKRNWDIEINIVARYLVKTICLIPE